jgi:hypothetical protein
MCDKLLVTYHLSLRLSSFLTGSVEWVSLKIIMGSSLAMLARRLLPVGAVAVAVCMAEAQSAEQGMGVPIIFSSPDSGTVKSNAISLAPKLPSWASPSPAEAPSTELELPTQPGQVFRAPSPEETQRMQKLLDQRKNWALLTPAEILGLPTQEKILGVQERDAFGQPKNETAVTQYYERQGRLRARTNNYGYNYSWTNWAPRWNSSGNRDELANPDAESAADSRRSEPPTLVDQLLGRTRSRRAPTSEEGAAEFGWPKPFSLAPLPLAPTPEQRAAMEQFQQLLQPHPLQDSTAKASKTVKPLYSSTFDGSSLAAKPPEANPLGVSFTPLSSGLTLPAAYSPLTGLAGQTPATSPAAAPEWKPSPPPWMSSTPQLGVIPQRKF